MRKAISMVWDDPYINNAREEKDYTQKVLQTKILTMNNVGKFIWCILRYSIIILIVISLWCLIPYAYYNALKCNLH